MKEISKKGVYLINLREVDYDEYNGFVIIAKDKQEAIGIMLSKQFNGGNVQIDNIETIKKVGVSSLKSQIVLSSFNAG